jgi:hypothetical protein
MQVAALLSDLKSLSVCSHEAAMALVSAHKAGTESAPRQDQTADSDLVRANELVSLHRAIQQRSQRPDFELLQARKDVEGVLKALAKS